MNTVVVLWQLVSRGVGKSAFRRLVVAITVLLVLQAWGPAGAADAPGAPGEPSVWAPAAKELLGTSASGTSRVYFTGAEGILTEVFYPTLDQVQNVDLQFLITDAAQTWTANDAEERKQQQHDVSQVDKRAMIWQVVTTADNGKWKITKKIFADPGRQALVLRVTFETLETGKTVNDYHVYLLSNPAINNSGGGDNSRTLTAAGRTMLAASEPNSTSSALAISLPWKTVDGNTMVSSGFVGRSDGWTDLFSGAEDKTMDWRFDGARDGNVAQMGWIDFGNSTGASISFDVVLAFGSNEQEAMDAANATLDSDLAALEKTYVDEWVAYCSGLDNQNGTADDQYYLAAMTLKCIQDKSNGAMIAGPGTPWGESNGDGNQGGYHLVWARDLYKFASALLAAGDAVSAGKAVDYLFNVQMQTTDGDRKGRFPQNTFVDGKPHWNATQMDQTAMPIILAWKVHQVAPLNLGQLWPKIKLAAEFLAREGPRTEQERWEEMAGYSPSTVAAEIAGLVCAASLADAANDPGAAEYYRKKADEWRNNLAGWTFTTSGFHGNKKYYIRINANQNPNDDVLLTFGNGGGTHGERYIVDGGFLELVRMGVMSPNNWTILETLPEYDTVLKQTIPGKGDAWFRYNYDGYGEHNDGRSYDGAGRGRLWPIFTAERGIYEIAKSGNGAAGQPYLDALKAFSSPAGLIPEQIWNVTADVTGWQTTTPASCTPGTATRSIRPLSWAMGEYINLVAAMNQGHGDAPAVVTQRYGSDLPQTDVTFNVTAETQWGQHVYLVGDHPLFGAWAPEAGIKLSPDAYPTWSVTVSLPASTPFQYKYVKRDESGQTLWESGANRPFTTPASGTPVRNETFRN
jgi:glucoamylase